MMDAALLELINQLTELLRAVTLVICFVPVLIVVWTLRVWRSTE